LDISIDLARRAVAGGARIIRVHDVAATAKALSSAP
jgi:dihydropteroate synthase